MRPSIKAPSWVYSSVFNIPACAIPVDPGWREVRTLMLDALYDLTDTRRKVSFIVRLRV